MLLRWLQNAYANFAGDPFLRHGAELLKTRNVLCDMFINAIGASSAEIDPGLQMGLGLLFYSGGHFERTIDCFSSALSVDTENYTLWNRLGATLANSGSSNSGF